MDPLSGMVGPGGWSCGCSVCQGMEMGSLCDGSDCDCDCDCESELGERITGADAVIGEDGGTAGVPRVLCMRVGWEGRMVYGDTTSGSFTNGS